ncbi:MAG: hypothetical protein LBK82_06775 [Planctomycetaceae bacterium]|jgi:hypothetical protein|nr:hypothetical protein [Planctomycetaceae bacterium]
MNRINLSQALRLKKRTKELIAKISQNIQSYNSVLRNEGAREIDVYKAMDFRDTLKTYLVDLKLTLQEASRPIGREILEVSELKDRISFLQKLNVKHGKVVSEGFHPTELIYDAAIRKNQVDKMCKDAQKQLDILYAKIDEFNSTHFVEVKEEPFDLIETLNTTKEVSQPETSS